MILLLYNWRCAEVIKYRVCVNVVPRKLFEHSNASLLLVCCCSFVTHSFPASHGRNVMADYIVEHVWLNLNAFLKLKCWANDFKENGGCVCTIPWPVIGIVKFRIGYVRTSNIPPFITEIHIPHLKFNPFLNISNKLCIRIVKPVMEQIIWKLFICSWFDNTVSNWRVCSMWWLGDDE